MSILGALVASCVTSCTVAHAAAPAWAGPGDRLMPYRQALDIGQDFRSPLLSDLDGDGHVDGVTADRRELSVFGLILRWNDGAGRLGPPMTLGVPGRIDVAAAADLDGDGLAELVAGDRGVGRLFVLRQLTPRAFTVTAVFEIDGLLRDLTVGDLTGDGAADVLVGLDGSRLALLRGDGPSPTWTELPPPPPGSSVVTSADVDGDGDQDLIAVRPQTAAPVAIARNRGGAAFAPFELSGTPLRGRDVLPMGTDERGNTILVVSGTSSRQISEVVIDAHGVVLSAEHLAVPYPPDRLVAGVGPGGAPRIFATAASGVGAGPMQAFAWDPEAGLTWLAVFSGNGDVAERLAAGDVDGNGISDLYVGSFRDCVLFDRPDGGHGPSIDYGGRRSNPVLADFDGDGDLDVAALEDPAGGGSGDARLVLIENDGRGRMRRELDLGPAGSSLHLIELDGIAPPELVSVAEDAVFAWRLDPDLVPIALPTVAIQEPESGPVTVFTGDVDGDGREDLILSESSGYRLLSYVPGQGFIRLIDRVRRDPLDENRPSWSDVHPVAWVQDVGDLDGDGRADLVATFSNLGLAVLRSRGGWSFDPPSFLNFGREILRPRLLDLTGEGVLDLVVDRRIAQQRTLTTLRRGLGDGTFEGLGPMVLPPSTFTRDIMAVDHDGDGRLDILGGSDPFTSERRLGLAAGTSDVDYGALVPGEIRLTRGVAGDMDADGDQDLVGAASLRLIAMLNGGDERVAGDATADRRVDTDDLLAILSRWGPCTCPADLDRDGIVDHSDLAIVIANWNQGNGR